MPGGPGAGVIIAGGPGARADVAGGPGAKTDVPGGQINRVGLQYLVRSPQGRQIHAGNFPKFFQNFSSLYATIDVYFIHYFFSTTTNYCS